jgi:hypothetical protein
MSSSDCWTPQRASDTSELKRRLDQTRSDALEAAGELARSTSRIHRTIAVSKALRGDRGGLSPAPRPLALFPFVAGLSSPRAT